MVQYVEKISTKDVYITLFAILSAIQYGAGGFLGNVVGGAVYNNYSGPLMCRFAALFGGLWLALVVLYFHGASLIRRTLSTKKTDTDGEEDEALAV